MQEYFENIIETLQENIRELSMEIDNPIVFSELAVKLSLDTLSELKKYVLEHPFQNIEDEIWFFKNIKPKILSKLIYHNSVFRIETKKPNGGEKIIRKYYEAQLAKLKNYFENNLEFYKYYRTGNTFLDDHYFVRGKYDIKLSLDTYFFESDHSFTTSHDYKVAKIIANDQLQVYLENELTNLYKTHSREEKELLLSGLKWTAPKVSLIELLYSLHAEGVFNNGAVELKEVAESFEKLFNIDLGQFHRTFLEVRIRKSSKTKFLDTLKDTLEKRMEDADEN